MEKYRCKSCGYFHVGPAPEKCPVCGAPQNFFEPYEGPGDLSGTQTLENLKAAFAGESQANRRYTLWRRIAELEGAPQSALDAFDRAAAEETAHALGHLAYMGGFGPTAENLEQRRSRRRERGHGDVSELRQDRRGGGLPGDRLLLPQRGPFENEHRGEYVDALDELQG